MPVMIFETKYTALPFALQVIYPFTLKEKNLIKRDILKSSVIPVPREKYFDIWIYAVYVILPYFSMHI